MLPTSVLSVLFVAQSVLAFPSVGEWQPAGPTDKRSPCPAINTLANHGYLPRDGLGVTAAMLQTVMPQVYGIDVAVIKTLTDSDFKLETDNTSLLVNTGVLNATEYNATPQYLNLDDLKKHNRNEHDASLSRLDSYFNASQDLDMARFQRLYTASSDGQVLNKYDVCKHRVQLVKDCRASNPTCKFGAQELIIATGENVFTLHVLGHKGQITLDHLYSFFVLEQIPADYVKSTLTSAETQMLLAEYIALEGIDVVFP